MFELLENILGEKIKSTNNVSKAGLPIYLSSREMYKVILYDVEFILIVWPSGSKLDIRQISRQYADYIEFFKVNVAFSFDSFTKDQREALIRMHIPFVSLPGHVYLPFLGVYLSNRFNSSKVSGGDMFTPAAQMLYLLLAYSKKTDMLSKSEAAKRLGITNMSITRASAMLKEKGLLDEYRNGGEILMYKTYTGFDYFEKAKSYLINPVQRRFCFDHDKASDDGLLAGESALSSYSMLNPPRITVKAYWKKDESLERMNEIDPFLRSDDEYMKAEVWKYPPELFVNEGRVDPISLYCSLRDETDERIEEAMETVLEEYKWA